MKKHNYILGLWAFLAVLFLASCSKTSDNTPAPTRDSLLGKWMVTDSKKKATYEVTFYADSSSSNAIRIQNFAGGGSTVYATAYFAGAIIQLKTDDLLSNGWIVNGKGTVYGGTSIDWPYTIRTESDLTTHQSTFTKK
jgi:hypothetical protein